MTQEELYIWLLSFNSKARLGMLPDFNLEFLKNYEIAKVALDKFNIHNLYKRQQKYLNLDAVYNMFRTSNYVCLQHDIPNILELLPEKIVGTLDFHNSQIHSLPKLESVGGYLDLANSQIQSLPKLRYVEGDLYLSNSKIQSLPELKSVGRSIYTKRDKLDYWMRYFNETRRPLLAERVITI